MASQKHPACPECGAELRKVPDRPPEIEWPFVIPLEWTREGDWHCPGCKALHGVTRTFWDRELKQSAGAE